MSLIKQLHLNIQKVRETYQGMIKLPLLFFFCYNTNMSNNFRHTLKWLILLILAGITAGAIASFLALIIHHIQLLSFGTSPEGAYATDIHTVTATRRIISVLLSGCLAAFGWFFMTKKMKPLHTIKETSQKHIMPNPLTNLVHGFIQLVTVSMGSPLGREGATREVAVATAAIWIEPLNISKEDKGLLLACTSGAALGAVYNAPIATVFFIIESILYQWNKRNLLASVIVSFVAVFTLRVFSGNGVQYQLSALSWNSDLYMWLLLASIVIAILANLFKKLINDIPKRDMTKMSFPISVFSAFAIVALLSVSYPQILGNGKAGLLYFLHQDYQITYTTGLVLAKAAAVFLTLYVGTFGGKIAPAMMLGGGTALIFASSWNSLTSADVSLQFATIIGAAIWLAIINNIPLAAIFFLIEITGQPLVNTIPLAIAMGVAYFTKFVLERITLKLQKHSKNKK